MDNPIIETALLRLIGYWQGQILADLEQQFICRRVAEQVQQCLPAPIALGQDQNVQQHSTMIRQVLLQFYQQPDQRILITRLAQPAPSPQTSVTVAGNQNVTLTGSFSVGQNLQIGAPGTATAPSHAAQRQSEPATPAPTPASTPAPIMLVLRFMPHAGGAQIIWEADVLGRRRSNFQMPYAPAVLPLVIRALDAVQWPGHPLDGPKFTAEEWAQLKALGLLDKFRVRPDIYRLVGQAIYQQLTLDSEGLSALRTVRDVATAQGSMLHIVLCFPPEAVELAALLWEILWDQYGAVLLSRGKTASCVRYLDLDQALPPVAGAGRRLRLLALAPHADVSSEVRQAEREARQLGWASLQDSGLLEIEELSPVTPTDLVNRLQRGPKPDILHFYGHGWYDAGKGALCFDARDGGKTLVTADKLAALLGDIRLIVLHACQSAMVGDAGLLTGVAHALSAAGVRAVVAMQLTMRRKAATRFAELLYGALARGEVLQQAVALARQGLYVEEDETLSWAVPTLTLRSRDLGPFSLL